MKALHKYNLTLLKSATTAGAMIIILGILANFGHAVTEGASAVQLSEVRQNITVDGPEVLLGDIFEGIVENADIYVQDSPAPGEQSTISATLLNSLASRYQIDWQKPQGFTRTLVTRNSNQVMASELELIIRDSIQRTGIRQSFSMTLFGQLNPIYLPVDRYSTDIEVAHLNLDNRTSRFSAVLTLPTGNASQTQNIEVNGRIELMESVPVLNRSLSKGDIATPEDISWENISSQRLGQNILLQASDIIGLAARRNLRAGVPLREGDMQKPVLINKGTLVVMRIEAGAMKLTAVGRALENGGEDDIIRLMNVDSHQTIEGRVIGQNQVQVLRISTLAEAR